ncbi:hypothetical protein CCAND95_50027 [Capnocytophaga canis]|uniref:Uncharacterized protein n=1 Tax=Capnocytophaga canis TaxID=1848903 RepID=A0A0B7IHI4_9FLAO|nr:hypothetical protein CCAND95_50027 [Capnocytophaga canis]CEN49428.1 hypothetical protein CCAND38_80104 [Capnocytophaga canis]
MRMFFEDVEKSKKGKIRVSLEKYLLNHSRPKVFDFWTFFM